MGEGAKRVRAGVSGSLYVGLAVVVASLKALLRQEGHVHSCVNALLLLPTSNNDITSERKKGKKETEIAKVFCRAQCCIIYSVIRYDTAVLPFRVTLGVRKVQARLG